MPLPYGFEKTLTEKTDEQLYDMLAHDADYLPEALAAVRMEIQRRNLSPTLGAQLESRSQTILAQEVQAAQQPLSWSVRLMLFLFGFTLFQILVASLVAEAYRNKGYTRRYKECWAWTWYGVEFWVLWGGFFAISVKSLDFYKVEEPDWLGVLVAVISAALSASVVALTAWFLRRRRSRHAPGRIE